MRRAAIASLACLAAIAASCGVAAPTPEPTPYYLALSPVLQDDTGLVLEFRVIDARELATVEGRVLVGGGPDRLFVGWQGLLCETEPTVAIMGRAPAEIRIQIHRGPLPDTECTSAAARWGVELVFNGPVVAETAVVEVLGGVPAGQ